MSTWAIIGIGYAVVMIGIIAFFMGGSRKSDSEQLNEDSEQYEFLKMYKNNLAEKERGKRSWYSNIIFWRGQ